MKTIFIITLYLSNLLWVGCVLAQTKEDISLAHVMYGNSKHKRTYKDAKQNKDEIEMVFSGMFLLYKTFISSQDGQSCSFTPSCSEYGLLAVKKQGAFIGVLNTLDRLTRCNGLSPNKYHIHHETHLLIDDL